MDWKKIPSLLALRAFEAAARHRSFKQASEELNVTQAAVAQHVRALERQLGEVLIVREGRGIGVTPTGRDLADGLFNGFSHIEAAVAGMLQASEDRALAVATTPSFATHWLMPRMGSFWSKYPDANISITPSISNVDLRKDGYDLAIRYGKGDWPGLDCELLTDGEFWVVAQPQLLEGRVTTCLEHVTDLMWLFDEAMHERRALVENEGIDFSALDVKTLATNTLVLSAVKAGIGVSVQSKSLVEDDVARGDLTRICKLQYPEFGYYLATIPERRSNGVKRFTAWLRQQAEL